MKSESMKACLLGGALGDSLGLPTEGMNARRIAKLLKGPLRQRLVLGYGMVSDDTEHAVMTLLSLNACDRDPRRFAKLLAGKLRWWLAGVPAGVGLATARSIMKLWIGISPARSGVYSAGNGPLMRAPVIGLFFSDDADAREHFIIASTRITHRDPKAIESAKIIAHAAAIADRGLTDHEILSTLEFHVFSDEMKNRFPVIRRSLADCESVSMFANRICRKRGYVTGFAPDSAAVAIFSWLRHRGDFTKTIEEVIRAGGDTDTIAFIAGSIAGIECGEKLLPDDLLKDLLDWPINAQFLGQVASGDRARFPCWPVNLCRNSLFLCVVLFHGFRRLLPPY